MKPWYAEAWDWDEDNEAELAAHLISPSEVEQVFAWDPTWAPNKRHRAGDWKMVGFTSGGRALTVSIEWQEDRRRIRPITGWDSTSGEIMKYLRGRS